MIPELQPIMDIVTDGLDPLPTARNVAELRPGKIAQLFRIAVATAQQIHQCVVWKLSDLELPSARHDVIRQSGIGDNEAAANLNPSSRRSQTGADIIERIAIIAVRNPGRESDFVFGQQIIVPRRVEGKHEHHRHVLEAVKSYVVAGFDFHWHVSFIGAGNKTDRGSRFLA
ncbi:hypothetical protein BraRD5C2_39900 [Bradyrhizobium sp. RD5-C2]|nr:hypothetical protein BraRD5C2_39900 [Bradyrhizobium sp. RD5-C2]